MEIILSLFLVAAPCPQSAALHQEFAIGLMPPSGWEVQNQGSAASWIPEFGILDGWHLTHPSSAGPSDSRIISPSFSLAGKTSAWLHFQQFVGNAAAREEHRIEISLDGGQSFALVRRDDAQDGISSLSLNLNPWLGYTNVRLAFRYRGESGSIWSIDQVLVWDHEKPPPRVLQSVFRETSGKLYRLLDQAEWILAGQTAELLGGTLAYVGSEEENDWIRSTFSENLAPRIWLGYTDALREGEWRWLNGRPTQFTNWVEDQPDDKGGQDFCRMNQNGKWADTGTRQQHHGAVEIFPLHPTLFVSEFKAGTEAWIGAGGFHPSKTVILAYSVNGPGPLDSSWGTVFLSPPIAPLGAMPANAFGQANWRFFIPMEWQDEFIWMQALQAQSNSLSNPVAVRVSR
ncbi:MAG: hypothetical protein DWQ01_02220 [Planctomycetota bacterium]|nr:MAG: hypothetical protein DWQ01_02220 [Planctomycetota bacterium]